MAILSTDQLISGLKNGRSFTPFSINSEIIDSYIDHIKNQRMVLKTDSKESDQLARHIKEPISFVSPERRQELAQCETYILPFPLCDAYTEEPLEPGQKYKIVIGNGLINLIANTVFLSHMEQLLPPELDDFYFLKYRRDMSVSRLFSNAIFVLHFRFYRYCEPLPNIFALLTPYMIQECKKAINGALVFSLLHELGHNKLGHFDLWRGLRPMNYQFAVQEDLSDEQHQEFEADDFAMNCLLDDAKILSTLWLPQALTFFVQMELVSGQTGDELHPMAINRSFYADALKEVWGKEHGVKSRQKIYEEKARRFHETRQSKTEEINALLQTPREGCLNILHEICEVLKGFGLDFEPLLSEPSPNWLELAKKSN